MTEQHQITELTLTQLSTEFARMRLTRPELIKSMEQSLAQFGQLSPIVVRQGQTDFQIIDGFKRYYAATALKWSSLQAHVLTVTRRVATAMILTYNRNNHSLTDYEEALVLRTLKITCRQMNRLLDEVDRIAANSLTELEWLILEPER